MLNLLLKLICKYYCLVGIFYCILFVQKFDRPLLGDRKTTDVPLSFYRKKNCRVQQKTMNLLTISFVILSFHLMTSLTL